MHKTCCSPYSVSVSSESGRVPSVAFGVPAGSLARYASNKDVVLNHRYKCSASNPGVPLISTVFPVTALAAFNLVEAFHQFDARDVLRVLVAELPLHA